MWGGLRDGAVFCFCWSWQSSAHAYSTACDPQSPKTSSTTTVGIIGIAGGLGSRLLCLIFKSLEGNFFWGLSFVQVSNRRLRAQSWKLGFLCAGVLEVVPRRASAAPQGSLLRAMVTSYPTERWRKQMRGFWNTFKRKWGNHESLRMVLPIKATEWNTTSRSLRWLSNQPAEQTAQPNRKWCWWEPREIEALVTCWQEFKTVRSVKWDHSMVFLQTIRQNCVSQQPI